MKWGMKRRKGMKKEDVVINRMEIGDKKGEGEGEGGEGLGDIVGEKRIRV